LGIRSAGAPAQRQIPTHIGRLLYLTTIAGYAPFGSLTDATAEDVGRVESCQLVYFGFRNVREK
jgi:hypothetical protein